MINAEEAEFLDTINTMDGEEMAALFIALKRSASAKTDAGHKRAMNDFWRFYLGRRGKTLTNLEPIA